MNFNYRGIGLVSLLMSIFLFSVIFLAINQWAQYQRKSAVQIYQHLQAIQIAENQQQRLFLKLPCDKQMQLNQITFIIQCTSQRVEVKYPRGKIIL